MKIIDALTAPWLIREETLAAMLEIYERHSATADMDIEKMVAASAAFSTQPVRDYYIMGGVAVLDVVGVLGKRFDMFTQICGGASTQRLQDELVTALEDDGVHSILLNVDSPGGEVDGIQALANDIYAARSKKTIIALIDGQGASGAYWAASSASKVYLASDTTIVGSIGVVMAHKDVSGAESKKGVKTTEITSGKYKRIASNYAPLTAEGEKYLTDITDHIYSVFVSAVARNRGVSVDVAEKDMADGRVFLGQQAITAGLADGFSTLGALIAELNQAYEARVIGATALNSNVEETVKVENGTVTMTEAEKTALENAAHDSGRAKGISEGATAERARIQGIEKLTLAGHETLIAAFKADGKTTPEQAAIAVLQAEQQRTAKAKADLKEDAPLPVTSGAEGADAGSKTEPDPVAVANKAKVYIAEQAKAGNKVSVVDAVAHVRKEMGLK